MRRYLLGKKHKVSVLRLNNKLGLGKRLPSLKQKDNEMENVNRLNDEEIYYDTWGSLFGHTRKIHGNEKRIFDNVKVKILDRNGAVVMESQKVLFKQELDSKTKKCADTYLEIYIK